MCVLSAQVQTRPQKIHAAYVYPAGGQAGTTFRVWVGGIGLAKTTGAILSDGIGTATLSGTDIPSTKGAFNRLKKEIEKKVLEKEPNLDVKGLNQSVQKFLKENPEYTERRKAIGDSFRIRELSTDALADIACFEVTLNKDAPAGMHSILLRTKEGLINPLPFMVDRLPEFTTPVYREVVKSDEAERNRAHMFALNNTDSSKPMAPQAADRFDVTLPVIVNGQITFAKPDAFSFSAKKGQKIVVAVWARALIPYISDAVPGWFQASVSVYDAKGEEIAYCDDFYHDPDPMLCFEVPEDGNYTVEIKDAVSRGREDLVYRMLIGEVPFVTGIQPLGVQAGVPTTLSLLGWNLPQTSISYTPPKQSQRGFLNLDSQGIWHKPLQLKVWQVAPAAPAPSTSKQTPTPLHIPCVVNGAIARAGDRHYFTFEGKKGQSVCAEVFARRLNGALDSFLILRDSNGTVLAQNDDTTDLDEGLITHHADARFICTLPQDGRYHIELGDTQSRGGEAYAYSLRLGAPQPDIALRITPSTFNIMAGKTVALTAHLARKGGFEGPVKLILRNAPKGSMLSGATIPKGVTEIPFTLTIPSDAQPGIRPLRIAGVFDSGGQSHTRVAVPAESMMQAFYLWHLVPYATTRMNVVSPRNFPRNQTWRTTFHAKPAQITSATLPRPGKFSINMGRQRSFQNMQLVFELNNAPAGITAKGTRIENGESIVDLEIDAQAAAQTPPGNLIFDVVAKREASPSKRPFEAQMDTVPAIPFSFEKDPEKQ